MTQIQTDPLVEADLRLVRARAILGDGVPVDRPDDGMTQADDQFMAYLAKRTVLEDSDPSATSAAKSFLLDRNRRQTDAIVSAQEGIARTSRDGKALANRILQLHHETDGNTEEIKRRIDREGWDRSLITPETIGAMDDVGSAASAAGLNPAAESAAAVRRHLLSMQPSRHNEDIGNFYTPPDYRKAGLQSDPNSETGLRGAERAIPAPPPNGYKDESKRKTLGDALTGIEARQIPFAGPAWEFVTKQLPALEAAHRIKIGEATDNDYATLAEYQAGLIRDSITPKTTLNKAAEFAKDSVGLGVELASGGLVSGPRKAAEKLVRNRAEKSIARSMVGAAASAAVSLPGQGGRIAEVAGSRMIPSVSPDGAGGTEVGPSEEVASAVAKGVLDTFIENYSERVGEVGKLLPGGKMLGRMRENLLNRLGIDPAGKAAKVIDDIARAGGYNGPIPELGEEYFGGVLKWATGLQDSPNGVPLDDLPAFALSTMVPGGASLIAKAGAQAAGLNKPNQASGSSPEAASGVTHEEGSKEGVEKGRQEGVLSPDTATTTEAAPGSLQPTPVAESGAKTSDRVGAAYTSELKRMGYSDDEIAGMDRKQALGVIRSQAQAFDNFVARITNPEPVEGEGGLTPGDVFVETQPVTVSAPKKVAEAAPEADDSTAEQQPLSTPEEAASKPQVSRTVEPGTPTTTPERQETIKAQLDELKAGKRPAVLVTPGAKAAIPPKGMKALRTKAGRFIYDPAKLTTDQIQAAVREDRIGEVLGYGISNKPEAGTEAGVVTVRDAEGVEKRAVVTDAANMASVVAEAQKVSEPGDTVAIEKPETVLRDRAGVENNRGVEDRDYRMGHRPNPDGPRAFDLNETDLAPDDIYDKPQHYVGDSKDKASRESIAAIRAVRGKPDATVIVYRASPAGSKLNAGDWVSLSKTYAKRHGMDDSDSSKDMPVIATQVKASDIRWAGDDLNEFGYYPSAKAGQAPGTQKDAPQTPQSRPKVVSEKVIAKADAIEQAARERIKRRQIPRGKNTGATTIIDDAIDHGIILAAKVARTGAKAARGLSKELSRMIAENPALAKYKADIARVSRRIIGESRGPDGTFDADKMDEAIGRVYDRMKTEQVSVKRAINETTGVRRMEEKTLTGAEALAVSLKREARTSREAFRAGVEEGIARVQPQLAALDKKVQAVKDRALKARLSGEEKAGNIAYQLAEKEARAIRGQVVRLIRENLPPELHGRFLTYVRDAKGIEQIAEAAGKARTMLAQYQYRTARNGLMAAIKKANPKEMLDEYRAVITEAKEILLKAREAAEVSAVNENGKKTTVLSENTSTLMGRASELREATLRAKEARAQQRIANRVLIDNRVATRDEVARGAIEALNKKKPIRVGSGLEEDVRANPIERYVQYLSSPEAIGDMIGDPRTKKLLTTEMYDGEDKVNADDQAGKEALRKAVEKQGFEWGSAALRKLSTWASGFRSDKVTFDLPNAGKVSATPAEWMGAYATLTDEWAGQNIREGAPIQWRRKKLGTPIKLTDADVAAITQNLDPKLRQIAEDAKEHIRTLREGLFAAIREMKGYDLIAHGGYWATVRDISPTLNSDTIAPVSESINRSLEGLSIAQHRIKDITKPYIIGDFFQTYQDLLHTTAVITHMTRRVRQAEYVFQVKELRQAIERVHGIRVLKQIDNAIENAKLIFVDPKTGLERASAYLNKQAGRALLSLNRKTMMKQLGGIAKLMPELRSESLAAGVAGMFDSRTTKILESSPYFRARYGDAIWRRVTPSRSRGSPGLGEVPLKAGEIGRAVVELRAGELLDRIKVLDWFDKLSARTAIAGKLHEVRQDHPEWSEEQQNDWAEREASYSIRRTQNDASPLGMSGMSSDFRGTPMTSALMFSSDGQKSFDMLAGAIASGDKERIAKTVAGLSVNHAWSALVKATAGVAGWKTLMSVFGGSGDDDEKKAGFAERLARAFFQEWAGAVQGIDQIAHSIDSLVDYAKGRPGLSGFNQSLPVIAGMRDVGTSLISASKAALDSYGGDQEKALKHLKAAASDARSGVGMLVGDPTLPIQWDAEALYKAATDDPPATKRRKTPSKSKAPASPRRQQP